MKQTNEERAAKMPPITLEQAKNLTPGTVLYDRIQFNRAGEPRRWRVNGKPKTWKRSPDRVSVPVKYGLRLCDYVTEYILNVVSLSDGSQPAD